MATRRASGNWNVADGGFGMADTVTGATGAVDVDVDVSEAIDVGQRKERKKGHGPLEGQTAR